MVDNMNNLATEEFLPNILQRVLQEVVNSTDPDSNVDRSSFSWDREDYVPGSRRGLFFYTVLGIMWGCVMCQLIFMRTRASRDRQLERENRVIEEQQRQQHQQDELQLINMDPELLQKLVLERTEYLNAHLEKEKLSLVITANHIVNNDIDTAVLMEQGEPKQTEAEISTEAPNDVANTTEPSDAAVDVSTDVAIEVATTTTAAPVEAVDEEARLDSSTPTPAETKEKNSDTDETEEDSQTNQESSSDDTRERSSSVSSSQQETSSNSGNEVAELSEKKNEENTVSNTNDESAEPSLPLDVEQGGAADADSSDTTDSDDEDDEDDRVVFDLSTLAPTKMLSSRKSLNFSPRASMTGATFNIKHPIETDMTLNLNGGTCPICLDIYEAGETIVASANPKACCHAFHQDCLVEYVVQLSLKKDKEDVRRLRRGRSSNRKRAPVEKSPCPCCRQDFLLLKKKNKKEKAAAAAAAAAEGGTTTDPATPSWGIDFGDAMS